MNKIYGIAFLASCSACFYFGDLHGKKSLRAMERNIATAQIDSIARAVETGDIVIAEYRERTNAESDLFNIVASEFERLRDTENHIQMPGPAGGVNDPAGGNENIRKREEFIDALEYDIYVCSLELNKLRSLQRFVLLNQ